MYENVLKMFAYAEKGLQGHFRKVMKQKLLNWSRNTIKQRVQKFKRLGE